MTQSKTPAGSLLALDLGTSCGWALSKSCGGINFGSNLFKPSRYEGGGMRYLRFDAWLNEMENLSGPIQAVWFEEVRRHVGTDAAHVYGGFLATLSAWCEQRQIPYAGLPVGTIKKFATGKGNARKAEVIAAMQARGHEVVDDNEADALAILHWALEAAPGQGGRHASS